MVRMSGPILRAPEISRRRRIRIGIGEIFRGTKYLFVRSGRFALNQKGFTLIELVMVIVILAILGSVAIPQFVNLQTEAKLANESGVAGGVRAGILTYFIDPARGNRTAYPGSLEIQPGVAFACTTSFPCFSNVLSQGGITDQWTKLNNLQYRSTANSSNIWTYTPATGNFQKTVN